MNIEELEKPLNRANVKQRSKGSFSLSYIEGWWAISEANRIFGFDGWDRDTMYNKEVSRHEYDKQGVTMYKVGYEAKVAINVIGDDKCVSRMGTGHGSGIAKDLFDAIEGAAKEAETDAMKRALMTFGNPFGLALYDKTQANVKDGIQGQIDPFTPIRQQRVDRAAEVYRDCIDADTEEVDFKTMQHVDENLTNDERIAVINAFGKDKPEGLKRMYTTIINECLKTKSEDT